MFTRSTSIPRPKISVATRIRFSKALNAEYRLILNGTVSEQPKMEDESDVPFLLGETRVDTDTWKVARNKQFIQFNRASDGFHKDDDLFGEVKQ